MLAREGRALLVRALRISDERDLYDISVLKYGSGDLLCKLEECCLLTGAELKRLVEVKTGLDPELTVLFHAEYGELEDCVRLTDLVGFSRTIDLYAKTLMKVIVAQHLKIAPREVTNDRFNTVCAALVSEPVDILDLSGCYQIDDFSGLVQLSMLSSLNLAACLAGNRIKPECAQHVADAIKVSNCVVLLIFLQFSSGHWLNYCYYPESID
jgi:hypothetical protein